MTRSILAVAAGGLAALITYYAGAVLALLLLRGIPLGSSGGPPTRVELIVHLVLGAMATFLGAGVVRRLSRTAPLLHIGVLVMILAVGAFLSFGKPASSWPAWFGSGMAAMCVFGGGAAAFRVWRRA